jgi:hypothetical protein
VWQEPHGSRTKERTARTLNIMKDPAFPSQIYYRLLSFFHLGRLKGFLKKTEKGIFQASRTVPLLVPLLSRRSAAGTAYSKIL